MGSFNHLPTEIVLDILTRLPTELVLECKLVCKPWRNLVSHHPSFSQLHLSHLNRSIDSAGKLGYLVKATNDQIYYFEYDDEAPVHNIIRRFNFTPPYAYIGGYSVLGSFNGLVCLYDCGYPTTAYCICNPLTREYVKLPEFKRDSSSYMYIPWTRGFGYLPLSNEYKVVQIDMLRTNPNIVEVLVYTIGSGDGWRNVGRFDIQYGGASVEDGVFVNGALHCVEVDEGMVYVFDLTEEKFCQHVSPSPLPPGSECYGYIPIGVLDGVLHYGIRYKSQNAKCLCYDIWPLKGTNDISDTKEQVEQKPLGWSKKFGFPRRKPFAFTKSGGVLYFGYSSLGIYDAIASTSKELVHFSEVSEIYPHKNTFVSLKELGEDDVKIMSSAESSEDRKPCFSAKELAREDPWMHLLTATLPPALKAWFWPGT